MHQILNTFLLVYAALVPIVNPIGGAPIFLSMTSDRTDAERSVLARGIAINGLLLLIGSMLVGSHVLVFFGITLPVVRIAGGLVIAALAWKLLHSGPELEGQRAAGAAPRSTEPLDAFYPFTMPLTVGPGSISVAIALGSQRPAGPLDFSNLAFYGTGALAGLVAIAATIYVCYRYAEQTIAVIGPRGTNVVVRLSAFVLLCIGIQIIWNGYSTLPVVTR